jgi:O-acetyl-ADP-ribose deacetylase (regulator of RNase III)
MITVVRKGDVLQSEAQTLVNTVNTVGIMGKGIALDFKRAYPDMFEDYAARCQAGQVHLGEPYLYRRLLPPWIINFPTKKHWRSASRLDAIVQGLEYLASHVAEWGVESLAVPPLGCGHGQLEWDVVGPTLYRYLDLLPIRVELYAPFDADEYSITREFLAGATQGEASGGQYVAPAHVAVAEIVARLAQERYAWPVGHTRFQKLCYFAEAAGIPLDVEFEERPYGPFGDELKRVIARLVNNGILTQKPTGRYHLILPGPTFDDARARFATTIEDFQEPIQRVTDLMLRLPPRRIELAATVHFTATALAGRLSRPPTDEEVIAEVQRWKKGKFDADDVTAALASLAMLGWLELGGTRVIDRLEDDAAVVA